MAIDRETQVMMDAYSAGIRSPRELANFMAQVTHESNGLNRLEESFRYTRNVYQIPVQAAWREGSDALESARKAALQGKPEKLAELMYGGRNGNDAPGDGWNYRGRGYLPLNGKDNYRAAGEALGVDLVGNPELAAEPAHASKIAAWYWENRIPEQAKENVKEATRAINGKFNGLEDRERRFDEWERRLTPEVMLRLESGHVGKTMPEAPKPVEDPLHRTGVPHGSTSGLSPADQALLEQARKAVHELDRQHGRQPDQFSENLSGSLAASAKRDGLTRIDSVVLSDDASRAFAVQGNTDSPHKRVSELPTGDAVNTPIEQSLHAMKQVPDPAQAPSNDQPSPQQHPPPSEPGQGR